MTKQELKVKLYNHLLSLKDEEISLNEIDIMFALAKDEEVQKVLGHDLKANQTRYFNDSELFEDNISKGI